MHKNAFTITLLFSIFLIFASCKKNESVTGELQVSLQFDQNGSPSITILTIHSNGVDYNIIRDKKTEHINIDDGNGYVWHSGSQYEVKGKISKDKDGKDQINATSIRYLGGKKVQAVTKEVSVTESAAVIPVVVESEKVVAFKTAIVNIAATDGQRFLKVVYELGYDSDKYPNFEKKISKQTKQVESKAVEYLSALTLKEVLDKRAKANISADLKREVNALLKSDGVECSNFYIKDFIVQ